VTVLDKLPLLPHHHEPMAPIGYGLIAIITFMLMLLAVLAIGRGRPDRR
jgi:hypothetical protein